jgi:hypothetical protein
MAAGGGGRAPSYAPNGGIITGDTSLYVGEKSNITYRSVNNGTIPPYLIQWGYGQEAAEITGGPSIIETVVVIRPGIGAIVGPNPVSFSFKTILDEDGDPAFYGFASDSGGIISEDKLSLTFPTIEGIKITLRPRVSGFPPAWYVSIYPNWYSSSTTAGVLRCSVNLTLTTVTNSRVTAAKAVTSSK